MTLDPGFHEPGEAPWWKFQADDPSLPVVVKQWMKQAAEQFAVLLAQRNAGGEARVETEFMSVDGMTGYYTVYFNHPVDPVSLIVHRGDQTMEPVNASLEL